MVTRVNAQAARQSRGFTLLEVLIAVVIFSIGLIGVASMQAYSLQSNNSSFLRSQATALGYEIIDLARANRLGGVTTGSVDSVIDADELVASRLPSGSATIDVDDDSLVVTVSWLDDRASESGNTADRTRSVQLQSEF